VRYVVYRFFNGNARDSYTYDIEKSAVQHQEYMKESYLADEIHIERPVWIKRLYSSPSYMSKCQRHVIEIQELWESWNPPEEIGRIMKRSITDLL
jgi:hypothetical protein